MSVRSFTKIWIHMIWSTHDRERLLIDRKLRKEISEWLYKYSDEKNIYMKINYVNPEHVHALIDLPTSLTIENTAQLFKGSSSCQINKLVNFEFRWGKGYGAFSVSESTMDQVVKYIINQEEHHRKKTFSEEYEGFLKKYNLLAVNG